MNDAHVQVLAGVHVYSAAKRHRERGVALHSWRERVVKVSAAIPKTLRAIAHNGLAVSLSKTGRAREAIALHQKAISLDAKVASFYYNFAVSYLILGEFRKAQEQQQKLRDLDPAMAEHLATVIAKHQR